MTQETQNQATEKIKERNERLVRAMRLMADRYKGRYQYLNECTSKGECELSYNYNGYFYDSGCSDELKFIRGMTLPPYRAMLDTVKLRKFRNVLEGHLTKLLSENVRRADKRMYYDGKIFSDEQVSRELGAEA